MANHEAALSLSSQKRNGSYYTPSGVAATLVSWAVRRESDALIDPSCGDGRFIAHHPKSVGIERDYTAAATASERAPHARVRVADFFEWASATSERFDCVVGNPPFIRYQSFNGKTRKTALALCARKGATFSRLTSSWAPFLVAASALLKPSGRIAFIVPAEIGHAPYAAPLLEFLAAHFGTVHVIAIREKIFPHLSEDCWLLYASDFGLNTDRFRFSSIRHFTHSQSLPSHYVTVTVDEWSKVWNSRLRPLLLTDRAREAYRYVSTCEGSLRLGDVAKTRIGYVSGANDFFHLRPSQVHSLQIPSDFLCPTVRNGRVLPEGELTEHTVLEWIRSDQPIFLLRIPKASHVPRSVWRYLDTDGGHRARTAYKCRTRRPWYSVPDVRIPDLFLTYLSGMRPSLVLNSAEITCTNAVHCVHVNPGADTNTILEKWRHPIVELSCELEGHPLGGGVLKLEPREAGRILLPDPAMIPRDSIEVVRGAVATMRQWRHRSDS